MQHIRTVSGKKVETISHFRLKESTLVSFCPIQSIRSTSVHFGPLWPLLSIRSNLVHSVHLGLIRSISVHFGYSVLFCPFGPVGIIRSTLIYFGSLLYILVHLGLFGLSRFNSVHFGLFSLFRSTLIHSIYFRVQTIQSTFVQFDSLRLPDSTPFIMLHVHGKCLLLTQYKNNNYQNI